MRRNAVPRVRRAKRQRMICGLFACVSAAFLLKYFSDPAAEQIESGGEFNKRAGVAELADATDLGSVGKPCRFKPCRPYQNQSTKRKNAHRPNDRKGGEKLSKRRRSHEKRKHSRNAFFFHSCSGISSGSRGRDSGRWQRAAKGDRGSEFSHTAAYISKLPQSDTRRNRHLRR